MKYLGVTFSLVALCVIDEHWYGAKADGTSTNFTSRGNVCTADPRIKVFGRNSHPTCLNASVPSDTILLDVLQIHDNPYHAFFDITWVVSFFLQNCLIPPYVPYNTSQVYLHLRASTDTNLEFCYKQSKNYSRWTQPTWGVCMLYASARAVGIPDSNIHTSARNNSKCYKHRLVFKPGFIFRNFGLRTRPASREVGIMGRLLSGNPTGSRSKLSLLPKEFIDIALRQFVEAPFKVFGQSPTRTDTLVRVLVYDRQDRRPRKLKRKWKTAAPIVQFLKRDRRVSLRYYDELPMPLAAQAQLFRWADILIAPHGAAMANTIFMLPGSQVLEIWKCCKQEVRLSPTTPRNWTGWHADRFGLKLYYFQCFPVNQSLSIRELRILEVREGEDDQWCKLDWIDVDHDHVKKKLDASIAAQSFRIRTLSASKRGDQPRSVRKEYAVVYALACVVLFGAWLRMTVCKASR